jgi:RNA polymerase sigma factor (sigma-70 family)
MYFCEYGGRENRIKRPQNFQLGFFTSLVMLLIMQCVTAAANERFKLVAMASTGTLPVRKLDKAERAEMVQFAVDALSERQRTALLLNKFENLSYQEIADTMGLTVQAVKSLLSRARVNLKSILQPYLDEGQLPQSGSQE